MFETRLSNEELKKYPYPNLIAEIIGSHYSMQTLGEHMGLISEHDDYDESRVIDKLRGASEISFPEAAALVKLFETDYDYLFADYLKVICGEPKAYWRWRDANEEREREIQEDMCKEIEHELRKKPYILEFIKEMVATSENERLAVAKMLCDLRQEKGAVK